MMIYPHVEPASVDDIEALLIVQDSQFEKYKQELPSSSVSLNVAQAPALPSSSSSAGPSDFQSNNGYQGDSSGYQDQNDGYHGSSRGRGCGDGKGRGCGGNKPICQLCHKYGHEAYNCWYVFDQTYVPPPAPTPQYPN